MNKILKSLINILVAIVTIYLMQHFLSQPKLNKH